MLEATQHENQRKAEVEERENQRKAGLEQKKYSYLIDNNNDLTTKPKAQKKCVVK